MQAIQPHHNMTGEVLAHRTHKLGLFYRLGTNDHIINTRIKVRLDHLGAANAATQLDRQIRVIGRDHGNQSVVDRVPFKGPIQINQVQSLRTLADPVGRDAHWVIGIGGRLFQSPLLKIDNLAILKINCRNNLHYKVPFVDGIMSPIR